MTVTLNIRNIGKKGEIAASFYLQKKGLTLLEQNFSCKLGEIDLIMKEGENIIFVEVRARHISEYGTAIESITRPKQKKIIRAATFYLQQQNWFDKVHCRFDVVGISYDQENYSFDWIKNAFSNGYC